MLLVLPNVSRYAQEHRPYAFALLFTVLTVTLWHISVTRDRTGGTRSRWWSAGYAVAAAGMGLAHLYTLTLLPALAVAAVAGPAEDRRRRLLRTVIPALAAVLAISPHIWLNLAHPTGSPTDPPLSPGSVLNVIGQMMPSELTAALGVLALVGFAVGMRRAHLRPALTLAVVWVLVPAVLLLAAKVTADLPVTRVRYLLFVMPGVALLVALGLRHLARLSPAITVLLLVALAVIGLPRQVDLRQVDGHHTDQALAPLLRSARALDIPAVTANPQAVRLVNAATYPEVLLTTGAQRSDARYGGCRRTHRFLRQRRRGLSLLSIQPVATDRPLSAAPVRRTDRRENAAAGPPLSRVRPGRSPRAGHGRPGSVPRGSTARTLSGVRRDEAHGHPVSQTSPPRGRIDRGHISEVDQFAQDRGGWRGLCRVLRRLGAGKATAAGRRRRSRSSTLGRI